MNWWRSVIWSRCSPVGSRALHGPGRRPNARYRAGSHRSRSRFERAGLELLEEVITYEWRSSREIRASASSRLQPVPVHADDASPGRPGHRMDQAAFPGCGGTAGQSSMFTCARRESRWPSSKLDGEPVAYFGVTLFSGWGHLDRIAVVPDRKGGVRARSTLGLAVDAMRQRGARRVGLSTQRTNYRSQRLYERFGFQRTSEHDYRLFGRWRFRTGSAGHRTNAMSADPARSSTSRPHSDEGEPAHAWAAVSARSFGSPPGVSHTAPHSALSSRAPGRHPATESDIQLQLDRRRVGQSKVTSPRGEKDRAEILSGVFEGRTTGAPISMITYNHDADSSKYENLRDVFRPGHADYTYWAKYGHRDHRGGGRSSARETWGRVAAGAIARKILASVGVEVYGFTPRDRRHRDADVRSRRDRAQPRPLSRSDRGRGDDRSHPGVKESHDSLGGVVEVRAIERSARVWANRPSTGSTR